MSDYHIPVMLAETVASLNIQKDQWYVDCNLGGGGHTEAILAKGGRVIGLDLDPAAISEVANNHKISVSEENGILIGRSENLILVQSNFAEIDHVLDKLAIPEVSGILFDLGVSSGQLQIPERGFSFSKTGTLDMRMDPNMGVPAKDLVNALHEGELTELFTKFGEESFAKPIARRIVQNRQTQPIETTDDLVKIILSVKHRNSKDRIHPATQVFQALRIAVNDELNSLKIALPKAISLLKPQGMIVVISFHSLEDRIVKNTFKQAEDAGKVKIVTPRPWSADDDEQYNNPRSRSAKMRILEKI